MHARFYVAVFFGVCVCVVTNLHSVTLPHLLPPHLHGFRVVGYNLWQEMKRIALDIGNSNCKTDIECAQKAHSYLQRTNKEMESEEEESKRERLC